MPIGLYIHVPFCIKKCNYCDFVSYPYHEGLAVSYVSALDKEMGLHMASLHPEHREVKSIYLGGGTPSTLPGELLRTIVDNCRQHFTVTDDAEITVECNPCTVDFVKFNELRKSGVNRISMGVQAYQQELLSRLGRTHSWREVVAAARNCRQAGFDNISFDLIFGIPGQAMKNWRETLERIVELDPVHISAYNLKIEPDTPLHRDVAAGYLVPCDEDLELEMFWHAINYLTGNGFIHYEISNFARPGRAARHNLIYWLNGEYLGLGPAAHSMLNGQRFSNERSVELYINKLKKGEFPVAATHRLSRDEEVSETVFLGLRLIRGLDINAFEERFGQSLPDIYGIQVKKLVGLGLVELKAGYLRLTEKGLPIANEVFAEFV